MIDSDLKFVKHNNIMLYYSFVMATSEMLKPIVNHKHISCNITIILDTILLKFVRFVRQKMRINEK